MLMRKGFFPYQKEFEMAYSAQNNQTYKRTGTSYNVGLVLAWAEAKGWEDCEVDLLEWVPGTAGALVLSLAEFPCTYRFHYGEESHDCELTSNRPDSYCEVHSA